MALLQMGAGHGSYAIFIVVDAPMIWMGIPIAMIVSPVLHMVYALSMTWGARTNHAWIAFGAVYSIHVASILLHEALGNLKLLDELNRISELAVHGNILLATCIGGFGILVMNVLLIGASRLIKR